jgi:hypothetical protein
VEKKNMEAMQVSIQSSPCCGPLPDLEGPMINTMVACLGSEHRKLNGLIMQLALAATRLTADPEGATVKQRAVEVWNEIRRDLWSHLQIEDELVFSWGEAHHAVPGTLLETLKIERQEMRKLIGTLPALLSGLDGEPQPAADRAVLARMLLALARTLDSHIERYDGEVLPSILRAPFHR